MVSNLSYMLFKRVVIRKLYPELVRDLWFQDGSEFTAPAHFATLFTSDPHALPLPSPFLFDVHRRFATAIHLFAVEDQIAQGWPRPRQGTRSSCRFCSTVAERPRTVISSAGAAMSSALASCPTPHQTTMLFGASSHWAATLRRNIIAEGSAYPIQFDCEGMHSSATKRRECAETR